MGTKNVIDVEFRLLLVTAFKSQLGEIRTSLKNIKVLRNRVKMDPKKDILDIYKDGLKEDLVKKAKR
jgi:hypothetical protein